MKHKAKVLIPVEKKTFLGTKKTVHEKRTIVEPGPNDPCPCGSGKKYKKCCGR